MTDLDLLRQLFYARVGLGGKVDDYIAESDPELWRRIYARLHSAESWNHDAAGPTPESPPVPR